MTTIYVVLGDQPAEIHGAYTVEAEACAEAGKHRGCIVIPVELSESNESLKR